MIDYILKIGDWIQEKSKTMSGVLVLGILIGAITPSTATYVIYLDGQHKDKRIIELYGDVKKIEKDKDEWQNRAFDSESACLAKMKEMATFFNDLDDMYKDNKDISSNKVNKEEKELQEYKKVIKNLTNLKNDLNNEN
jgi:hypothetical protein